MPCVQLITGYDACGKLALSAAGLKTRVYIGLISDLDADTPFNLNGSGDVDSINFQAYKGFVRFTGVRNGNTANVDAARTEDGNPFYTMSVVLKMFDVTSDDKTVISNFAAAEDLFAVIETAGKRFEIIGDSLGLTLESAPKTFGNVPTDSSARLITLSGDQSEIEKIFSNVSYSTTVTTLDSYVV